MMLKIKYIQEIYLEGINNMERVELKNKTVFVTGVAGFIRCV